MRFLTLALFAAFAGNAPAQTTLFAETFEGTPAFTLNTADAASVTGIANTWLVNNVYAGGSGVADCVGIPLDFDIAATATQPAGISSPGGYYLHTASLVAIQNGIQCCSFGAADGFCTDADDIFSRMSTDVSTLGQSEVSLKFWWLCNGGNQNYGQVFYSTTSGSSWTQVTTPISNYRNQVNWVEQTITLPEFANQATLRFGFRFHNGTSLLGAADPGFAIDDVRVIASTAVPASISTSTIAPLAYCQGATLSVPFTATGTFNAGNVFTAELSDATGGFTAPVAIGTLSATASGTIACTLPALTPVGTGYRVRVVSSDPVTIGTANTADITVSAAPYAGPDDLVTLCKNSGTYALLDFLPGASTCGAWVGPLGAFSGSLNTATDQGGVYTYTTDCPGGCAQDAATLTVVLQDPANAGSNVTASLCATGVPVSLISYVSGGDLTGIFFYNGAPTSGSPLNVPGTYPMDYVVYGTAPCTNDTAEFLFTVNAPANAGANTSVTICQNDAPVQLFSLLGASAQPGGTWTAPGGGAFAGTVDPASDASGLYTYTVDGLAPCVDAQAFVAVIIDPCAGVQERTGGAVALQWLGQQGTQHLFQLGGAVRYFTIVDAAGRDQGRVTGPFEQGRVYIELGHLSTGAYMLQAAGATSRPVRVVHVR